MASRSPAEAVEAYRRPLQRIHSCITPDVLVLQGASRTSPYEPRSEPHLLELGDGSPVRLGASDPLRLKVFQMYRIVSPETQSTEWSVHLAAYIHSLIHEQTGEIVAYHWQPDVRAGTTFPHLHVGPAIAGTSLQIGNRYVHRVHFPTGLVPLSSIVRLAIEELEVRPLRDDWDQVLTDERAS